MYIHCIKHSPQSIHVQQFTSFPLLLATFDLLYSLFGFMVAI